jgi:ABC-2 type transport system permease protein
MTLALTHARYQLLETARIPIAIVGSAFFPAAAMLFFVVPNVGESALGATMATASMMMFTVMSTSLFTYGVGVAEDRAQPWDPYLRTLPAGAFPRFAGRVLCGLAVMAISLVPVLLIAAFLTPAATTIGGLLLGLAALTVGSIPFTLIGLFVGYMMPTKAAVAVVQVIFFPMAVGGGLLTSPIDPPAFIEAVAPFLPSRGAVELVWAAVGDFSPRPLTIVMLVAWTVVAAAGAVWGFRRDEGRRFS